MNGAVPAFTAARFLMDFDGRRHLDQRLIALDGAAQAIDRAVQGDPQSR